VDNEFSQAQGTIREPRQAATPQLSLAFYSNKPQNVMNNKTIISLAIGGTLLLITLFNAVSQETSRQSNNTSANHKFEYATVRFMEEKTSIVWPDGTVENVLALSGKTKFDNGSEKYPKGSDYRLYWLTVAMNIMAKRGFELALMADHDVVMKRQISK
jgi:hypothetical protein